MVAVREGLFERLTFTTVREATAAYVEELLKNPAIAAFDNPRAILQHWVSPLRLIPSPKPASQPQESRTERPQNELTPTSRKLVEFRISTDLNKWASAFARELVSPATAAMVGAGGIVTAVFGGASALPVAAFVIAGTTLWCGIRAFPRRIKDVSALIGRDFSLGDLAGIYPPVFKLALVGPPGAGKTMLLDRIAHLRPRKDPDTSVHARIFDFDRRSLRLLAVLEGPLRDLGHQLVVGSAANLLMVVLDHNRSDGMVTLDEERLKEQKILLTEMRGLLRRQPNAVKHVVFLLNKRDLWEGKSSEPKLMDWFGREVTCGGRTSRI